MLEDGDPEAAVPQLPADADPARRRATPTGWRRSPVAEAAKRRLIFQLLDLGLPIEDDLRFDLLSSAARARWSPVTPTA